MENFFKSLGILSKNTISHVCINATPAHLIEDAIKSGRGSLSKDGALVVRTGKYTGRAAKDKFVVKNKITEKTVWWENDCNVMTPENFEKLRLKVVDHLNKSSHLYFCENSVGAHPTHNISIRLLTTGASHALFASYMFREKVREFGEGDFVILHAPEVELNPVEFNTKSEACIVTCFERKMVIIVGTYYAGELKKSIFSAMNFILPPKGILPMHAGANKGHGTSDISVFFGLSGTGKTTLSTDDGKMLIGDDEHGLSDSGVFNFEGGCYAKTIKLKEESEPGIWKACNRFGTLLENVVMGPHNRTLDFDDATLSENGRSSYPLRFIDEIEPSSNAGIPNNIFFLTADAFGVLPPVSKLTRDQAMFYFVLGYTAKVAGTEAGIKEPQAAFSPCFGAPFMLRHPSEYAELLGRFLDKYKIQVWLINTGWTGGAYGVGHRYPIKTTRTIIRSIQKGGLLSTAVEKDPIFGLFIPAAVEGVQMKELFPQMSWPNSADYTLKAKELALMFHKKMEKFGDFYQKIKSSGPTLYTHHA